ncbi:SDR family NAD(P)-dependent oxidoreductase [Sphingobium sp. BYY-5]|uniref:SDR family NAD(P)-dependent oxidoreductase n=1 Tax=Sphingobium sp. BYY-5 TaxID=2926400 RepID=UPI001FA71ED5|nr:SDR family NAD(P)-dependent oxidoreductase [Sphingobium sp. BYY-5]MCI4592234.1 SDR family NAD(P)-dependent oxidoreductase [Sphingobium sp. BYY-5]
MKTWFITGASRGFGALVTNLALQQGDAVVATARNPQQIVDRFGDHPNLLAVALDVTDEPKAKAAADAAIARFGKIDVLLNNAGFGLMGAVEPGYFRTDFLDATSPSVSPTIIEDYVTTAGRVRNVATGPCSNMWIASWN